MSTPPPQSPGKGLKWVEVNDALIAQEIDAIKVVKLKNQLGMAEQRLARLEPRPVEEEP
jgi:hypothetical protein